MPDFIFHKTNGHGSFDATQHTYIVQFLDHALNSQLVHNVAGFEVNHLQRTAGFNVLAFQMLLQRQANSDEVNELRRETVLENRLLKKSTFGAGGDDT